MPINRYFKLYLNAGRAIPLVINVNQYDSGETWYFRLFKETGEAYFPSSGAIIGIKADGHVIDNAATVDGFGYVVVTETEQMTAAPGKAVFELSIDDNSHGTANFIVLVEPKPSEGGILSDSDLSLLQEAIDSTSPAAIAEGVSDWMDEHLTPTTPVVDDTLTVQGAAADAKKTGDEIADLKSAIEQGGGGLNDEAKQALLACFENAAWIGNDGQDYYDALEAALYPPANLVSISAVYTQSGTVYDTDSLDSLKSDLVVTAHYDDSSTETVTTYTLSGTLTAGTSTITVSYGGKTTTFNVTVTETRVPAEYQEVEYLLNTLVNKDNGAYLNTGVSFNSPTTAKVEIGYENIQFTNESTCYPFGTRKTNTGTTNDVGWGLSISTNQATGHGSWSGGPGAYAQPVSHYGRHDAIATWSASAVSLKLDELNLVTSTQTTRAIGGYPIGLLGVPSNTGNGATFMMNGKLFYAKIYADDVLLFDGIPCYRKSDNTPGIYDTVNDSFITASVAGNTGSVNCITAGPAV